MNNSFWNQSLRIYIYTHPATSHPTPPPHFLLLLYPPPHRSIPFLYFSFWGYARVMLVRFHHTTSTSTTPFYSTVFCFRLTPPRFFRTGRGGGGRRKKIWEVLYDYDYYFLLLFLGGSLFTSAPPTNKSISSETIHVSRLWGWGIEMGEGEEEEAEEAEEEAGRAERETDRRSESVRRERESWGAGRVGPMGASRF